MKNLCYTACYKTKDNKDYLFRYLCLNEAEAKAYVEELNNALTNGKNIDWLDTANIKYFYCYKQEEMY